MLRHHALTIRFNDDEYDRLVKEARDAERSITDLIRRRALSVQPVVMVTGPPQRRTIDPRTVPPSETPAARVARTKALGSRHPDAAARLDDMAARRGKKPGADTPRPKKA